MLSGQCENFKLSTIIKVFTLQDLNYLENHKLAVGSDEVALVGAAHPGLREAVQRDGGRAEQETHRPGQPDRCSK